MRSRAVVVAGLTATTIAEEGAGPIVEGRFEPAVATTIAEVAVGAGPVTTTAWAFTVAVRTILLAVVARTAGTIAIATTVAVAVSAGFR